MSAVTSRSIFVFGGLWVRGTVQRPREARAASIERVSVENPVCASIPGGGPVSVHTLTRM
eukprot:2515910-Prymnesium_polylepis.1